MIIVCGEKKSRNRSLTVQGANYCTDFFGHSHSRRYKQYTTDSTTI